MAAEQQRELGAILVEQGVLTARDRGLIDELIARQVEAAGGGASQVYNLYGGDSAMAQSFAGSLVFDRADGSLKYESLRPSPRPSSAPPGGLGGELADAEQLTTEHPGRYALKSEEGRGGVGRVLVAYDEHIHREIALKERLPESATTVAPADASPMRRSAALTARFLREARITGQLEHPGIVPVYELGRRSDGTVYYTMKLVRDVAKDAPAELASIAEHCLQRDPTQRYQSVEHLADDGAGCADLGWAVCLGWPSVRMASCSPRPATMGQCGCGDAGLTTSSNSFRMNATAT